MHTSSFGGSVVIEARNMRSRLQFGGWLSPRHVCSKELCGECRSTSVKAVDAGTVFLNDSGHSQIAVSGQVRLHIHGYAFRRANDQSASQGTDVARWALEEYQRTGEIPVESLEGSFTITIVDLHKSLVALFRNLVGTGCTYYCSTRDGTLFSTNLADLVRRVPGLREANQQVLPTFFLYRCVPGRETLFKAVDRLLPGEEVVLDRAGIRRRQRQTLDDLREEPCESRELVEGLERTMAGVVNSYLNSTPSAANLLSGGVDSTYVQAHLCAAKEAGGQPSRSFCVHLDHPDTAADALYAETAAHALQVEHRALTIHYPIYDRMQETIAATGEPLNHVQTAYFLQLARYMSDLGSPVGFCGEGADSLFGVGDVPMIRGAQFVRAVLPSGLMRSILARAAQLSGHGYLHDMFRVANALRDENDLGHPVNQIAMFTDLEFVEKCFSRRSITEALQRRRALLGIVGASDALLPRAHAMGYFGEAVETASLWSSLFQVAGGNLACPFLDSRLLSFAISLDPNILYEGDRPKWLLKTALSRYVSENLVVRPKLGFGQPIMKWMSSGNELHAAVEAITGYGFLPQQLIPEIKRRPSWFLYSLLTYDIWHKTFLGTR